MEADSYGEKQVGHIMPDAWDVLQPTGVRRPVQDGAGPYWEFPGDGPNLLFRGGYILYFIFLLIRKKPTDRFFDYITKQNR